MTHTMYLNHYGIPNRSFIDIATRVVPDNAVGSWTREPAHVETPKQPFPADDAWRRAEKQDLLATAAFTLTLFASAALAVLI
ncbi:MAG: hypothetical protein IPG17_20855 [Sandaracinaceae bacterium]|jgi:hypothetical protein|nr:hypothetical protein [Sandaracinaceae bacterium]MBK6810378.1 hypothetical protein [Sandaracinaceae bacterium]MBK7153749.1 hypothetical protein [Sandaracinaceae bacterium]MBK8408287.1 hypothetical protein [Sandaracinaceae bacterium]